MGWRLSIAVLVQVACSAPPPTPPPTAEERLRVRLGIPLDAKKVIVFAQAAHLDIDWQRTFDGYYQAFVGDILLEARGVLDAQPRAFYSVAEMGFLKHHLQLHPEELEALRAHAARGALRIVGGGITSPDTVLPETELLLRDFYYGSRFSEDTLGVRASSAWLPDSFGQSGTAPDILAAAGFTSVAFSRIDGAPTILAIIQNPPAGPPHPPGSTAAWLQSQGSADFVWRGPGGGEVTARWLASNLYCMGDDLDYENDLIQVPGGHLGTFNADAGFTDHQINRYVAALAKLTKTPYRFVPIGCDFQHPKSGLLSYLDGYNQRQYPTTGVWAVAAGFDDYEALLAAHRGALPQLEGDLTPYFMGFYGSRPEVKRRAREAASGFFAAETFAVALGDAGATAVAAAAPALEHLTFSNHHDFITGTANDEVTNTEQLPLLIEAQLAGEAAFTQVAQAVGSRIPMAAGATARVIAFNPAGTSRSAVIEVAVPEATSPLHAMIGARAVPLELADAGVLRLALTDLPPLGWSAVDLFPGAGPSDGGVTLALFDDAGQPASGPTVSQVVMSNGRVRAQWDRAGAFALTSLKIDGLEALAGRSFVPIEYSDQGGLWRLGNEMSGCALSPLPPDAGADETATLILASAISARVAFGSGESLREARLDEGDDGLTLALTTAAREATTRTIGFQFAVPPGAPLRTSQPGGYLDRSAQRVFTPTWWPAVAWVSSGPWMVALRQSTGARLELDGRVELLTARDARTEKCDIEGGTGSDPGLHRFEWYVARADDPAAAERGAQRFNRPVRGLRALSQGTGLLAEQGPLSLEGPGALSALKPAERGEGIIIRALLMPGPVVLHLGPSLAGRTLSRTDALERELEQLGVAGPTVTLDREKFGAIATVRLR